jgi:hypothetical protein
MTEFFATMMGRKFYEGDVPRLVRALEKIAAEMKRANDIAEGKSNDRRDQADLDSP